MRERAAREFIKMSAAYAKATSHVCKQFETSAGQTQHHTTLAQKVTTEVAQTIQAGVAKNI